MDSLAAQIMIDIINWEMQMVPNSVWLRDQNMVIPNDDLLYIEVGMIDSEGIANVTSMQDALINDVLTPAQVNDVQVKERIQIDLFSRSPLALKRNWEVIAAMQSFYAQQAQEANNFRINRQPLSRLNTSSAEGGSNINRYSVTFACFVWYRKIRALNSPLGDYYDDFTTRVDTEQTIGTPKPIIAFEITPSTPPPP